MKTIRNIEEKHNLHVGQDVIFDSIEFMQFEEPSEILKIQEEVNTKSIDNTNFVIRLYRTGEIQNARFYQLNDKLSTLPF